MKVIFPIIILLLALWTSQGESNPGLKLILTEKGLDYGASVAADVMAREAEGLQIDDFNGSDRVARGRVEYSVTGIRAYDFRKPTADVTMDQGSGVTVHFRNAAISARGDWRYRLRSLIRLRDHGQVQASTSSISISLPVVISADSSGKPTLQAGACHCDISGLSIRTQGGASWLYNLLLRMFKGNIERALSNGLCRAATKAINDSGNRQLDTLNLQASLWEGMVLDYSLTAPPSITAAYMEVPFKGSFVGDTSPNIESSLGAPSSHMVGISISQELFNSAARVVFSQGFLNQDINLDIFKRHLAQLDDDTLKDCGIHAAISLITAPNVSISTDNLIVSVAMRALVKASPPSAEDIVILTVEVFLDVGVNVFIRDARIRGALKAIESRATVKISEVGEVEPEFLEEVMKEGIRLMSPSINETLEEGMPLPSLHRTELLQAELKLLPSHVTIATNVLYTP